MNAIPFNTSGIISHEYAVLDTTEYYDQNVSVYFSDEEVIRRNKLLQDVRDFHTKFGFRDTWKPTKHNLEQRAEMKQEEVDEFKEAVRSGDRIAQIDAIIDLIYFALGTADLLDINFDEHWQAVQDANMEKVRGTKSTRPNSGGFDCIKPEGWVPPEARHAEILKDYPGLQED